MVSVKTIGLKIDFGGIVLALIREKEDRAILSQLVTFLPKVLWLRVVSVKTIGLKIDFGGIFLTQIRENLDRTICNNAGLFFLKLLWLGWSP